MNVLLIYKKSAYRIYGRERRDARFLRLLRRKDPSVALVERSDREHEQAMAAVKAALADAGCKTTTAYRARVGHTRGYDLVVTVGGDGTLLEAARTLAEEPVLGVNSSTSSSLGFFCGADARSFPGVLREFLAGRASVTRLARLRVAVNGRFWPVPVLNDVLFTHTVPAATSRYIVTLRGVTEEHRSSGIWWCTAAGSTAAMRSAGGRVMALLSRRVQFRIREPFYAGAERYRVLNGFLDPCETMEVRSKMRTAMIYMDGPHLRHPVHMGDVVTIHADGPRLNLIAFDRARRAEFALPRPR